MATTSQLNHPVAAKPSTLHSVIDSLDPILGRLESLAARTMSCGDRIVGSRPSAVEADPTEPAPNHLIWSLQARRERLQRVADNLEAEVSRIENGLA